MAYGNKVKALTLAVGLIAATASASLADGKSAGVTGFNPSPLNVLSNGQNYTKLDVLGMTNIAVNLQYDTWTAGRIKSWSAYPIITNGYGIAAQIQDLDDYKISKSYPIGSRPKSMNRNEVFSVPAFKLNNAAVGMCNLLASKLRDEGKSNKTIFGADRQVKFLVDVSFSVDASGSGSNDVITEAHLPKEVTVACKKWQGAQVPTAGDLKAPLEIKAATMKLQEVATMGGACMVKLTTAINTSEAGATLKFRYAHSSGKKSKAFTVKTAANKIAVVNHQWDIPNKDGREIGWMQLEGISPKFKSNRARYRMDCKSGGEVGGFKPQPGKPSVAVPLGGSGLKTN